MQLFQASALLVAIAGLPRAEGLDDPSPSLTPTYSPLPTYSPTDPPTLSCEDVDGKFKLIKPTGKKIGGFKEKTVTCDQVDDFIRFGGKRGTGGKGAKGAKGGKGEMGYGYYYGGGYDYDYDYYYSGGPDYDYYYGDDDHYYYSGGYDYDYYYDDYYYSKGGKSGPKITRGELVCGLDVVGGGFVHGKCGVTCHTNGFPCT